MKEERKPYYVRFMRLYKYLERKGYHYLYTRPDIKFPERIVWIYDNTDDLYDCVQEYWKLKDSGKLD